MYLRLITYDKAKNTLIPYGDEGILILYQDPSTERQNFLTDR